MKDIKLKKDKYRKARGGYSRFWEIQCEKCKTVLAIYQKDGPGALKRMYLDRIVSPLSFEKLKYIPKKKVPNLTCTNCKQLIGIPYIYKKEDRPAFRLFEGSVIKKITKIK
ncbi:MAG: hypothetical protein AAB815_01135 [Patescibacteria group bacterium]